MNNNTAFVVLMAVVVITMGALVCMRMHNDSMENAIKAGLVQKVEGGHVIWTKRDIKHTRHMR